MPSIINIIYKYHICAHFTLETNIFKSFSNFLSRMKKTGKIVKFQNEALNVKFNKMYPFNET